MNIFVLDFDIRKCAEYHFDSHVVKMVTESTQILSTVCRLNHMDVGYKTTHASHPCVKWAGESILNWMWLKQLTLELNEEWKYRYEHTRDHKAWQVCKTLPLPDLPNLGVTNFALATNGIRLENAVKTYREYYRTKDHLALWTKRPIPKWFYEKD